MATASITEYPEVIDAAISQKGNDVSPVLIVGYSTSQQRAEELGDNFVRMVKSLSQDSSRGKDVGKWMYSYLIGVYYPNEKELAQGGKSKVSDRISWYVRLTLPSGPKGENRLADTDSRSVMVAKIYFGEIQDRLASATQNCRFRGGTLGLKASPPRNATNWHGRHYAPVGLTL